MKPFGCPVTILNTIDHPGKFDGKADEGFFVGYSTNSKAFRVFNSRTRIVEKNLHVKFSEETPNIAGNGLNWIFDINALTISINYKPVVAGNQTNGNDAGFSDTGFKPSRVEEKIDFEHQENEDIYGCIDDPNMPNLEEIVYSDDDEEVGAEADINNLATTVPVSPIPTTRVHKDHPLEQIIRDIHSAPQTRRMTKNVTEHVEPKKLIYHMARGRLEQNGSTETRKIKEMDVKSAFLYGKIEEEVYVYQPQRFEDPKFPDIVYKVEKALYGLHQALRAWYETLSTYLLDNRF
ncbi:putative ribonuclease H-like domain-containing protein [Tanacetum coccineum]